METHGALIAVIGDEETVTGMLLAGVGNVDARRTSNFMVVDSSARPPPHRRRAPTGLLTSAPSSRARRDDTGADRGRLQAVHLALGRRHRAHQPICAPPAP